MLPHFEDTSNKKSAIFRGREQLLYLQSTILSVGVTRFTIVMLDGDMIVTM